MFVWRYDAAKMPRDFEPEWMIDPAGWWWVRVVPDEEPVRPNRTGEVAQIIEFPRSQKSRAGQGNPTQPGGTATPECCIADGSIFF